MVQPPSVNPLSPSQYSQQFLSSVLSQRGPSALPYTEDVKWLIRQHLVSLSDAYPSLQPKTATFTHNDGTTVNLLQSDGTIPMLFQNITYNIPVVIWLMESYPRHPPLVFVNPTRDMIIKRPHSFVNPSGMVSIPYLHNWVYPSSNLVDLSKHLSHYFARDPPLYSQRRPVNVNPSIDIRPSIPPRAYPQTPVQTTEDPSEVFKRNAMNKLVENVGLDIENMRKGREGEVDALFNVQANLRKRDEELGRGMREMGDEKEGLEQQLQMVLMNSDVLENWLRGNESKIGKNVHVDDVFMAVDGLSKQMMECTAADLAIEDVVYALDKAVQDGAIPFDQYLRSVRLLSREQFVHRATASKVRAAQMQTQVTNMASRVAQYVG